MTARPAERRERPVPFLADIRRYVGQRVTLCYEDPLNRDGANLEDEGQIVSPPEQHGYITAAGGWALYGREGDRPSYRFGFRKKGKRKARWRRVEDLIGVYAEALHPTPEVGEEERT